jgi:pimeloyl-ACP methyl ester carboxylesterase
LYDTSDPKALYVEDRLESIISIHGSRIITIPNAVLIYNDSPNIINAQNNWWGDETGPKFISGRGKVLTEPFLIEDPDKKEVCCSNVLFIPGFEGSRLYKDNSLIGTNTLWEPNRNEDVKKLFMDSLGNSIDKEIYTKDIISTALGVKAIYKAFINSMDGLVEEGKINSWLPLPYDWRKSIDDLSDADMLKAVTDLAADSKTGRIIIIAHSNGGLVAKRLMQKIEANNGMDVVERIINVAVPELGTPEAILSMLHGYNQEMGWGAVMSENIARTLSQNLPGAYGLLPSKKFFDRNPFTVISDLFSASTLISSFDMMKKFLLTSGFGVDSSTNTTLPLHLNSVLIDSADSSHTTIDDWKPASSTKTLSIFGWGLATSRGIEYHRDPHCLENQVCEPEFVASTTPNISQFR